MGSPCLISRRILVLAIVGVLVMSCRREDAASIPQGQLQDVIPKTVHIRAMRFRPSKGHVEADKDLEVPVFSFARFCDALTPCYDDEGDTPAWALLGTLTIITTDGRERRITVFYGDETAGAFAVDGRYYRGGDSQLFVRVVRESLNVNLVDQ